MTLTKKTYFRSQLTFDASEKETLTTAYNIIEAVRFENTHSGGANDDDITEKCDYILDGISALLDNYSRMYSDE